MHYAINLFIILNLDHKTVRISIGNVKLDRPSKFNLSIVTIEAFNKGISADIHITHPFIET